jgi:glutamine synthetase
MREGILSNLSPGKPVTGDGYAKAKKTLPVYMPDAVNLFSKSDFIRKSMGAEFQRIFTLTKEQEIAEFRRQISTLEYRSYLEQL